MNPIIIKKVQGFNFELIDFLELYNHIPIHSKYGKAFIEGVNPLDNTVTYRPLNNPKVTFTSDVKDVKLMLRKLSYSYFRGKDTNIIAGLALDIEGFKGSVSREDHKMIIEDGQSGKVIVDLSRNMVIETEINGETIETKNISFIVAYMIKNGFDLYDLTNRGFAISVNAY